MVPSSDWVDVEEVIKNTSSNLPVGQLFAVGNFSLFDAMSAVEIGNPKMDANMTLSANVDDLLEQGLAPQELSSHQVLAIMDHLFLMEATWHTGGSLAQTLFSCLYMLRPERAQGNLYLNSFCQTLRAATSEVRSLMFTGCVCEDEDCNPNAFGLPLDEGSGAITAEKVAAALTLAVDHLRHLKQYNRHTSNGVKTEVSPTWLSVCFPLLAAFASWIGGGPGRTVPAEVQAVAAELGRAGLLLRCVACLRAGTPKAGGLGWKGVDDVDKGADGATVVG